MTTARLATHGTPIATTARGAIGSTAPIPLQLRLHRLRVEIERTCVLFAAALEAAYVAESAPPRRAGELSRATFNEHTRR